MNEEPLTSAHEYRDSHCENCSFPSSPRSHFQGESRSWLGISVFIHIGVKTNTTTKISHLDSLLKRDRGELENGPPFINLFEKA